MESSMPPNPCPSLGGEVLMPARLQTLLLSNQAHGQRQENLPSYQLGGFRPKSPHLVEPWLPCLSRGQMEH